MAIKNPYLIEAASFRIAELVSHNFWVLRGPDYKVIAELHGLGTSRRTGRILPIGRIGDRLGFYEFIAGRDNIPVTGTRLLAESKGFKTMYMGDKKDVMGRWNNAVKQLESMNDRNIDYSPFGIFGIKVVNSNTAYRFFAELMGIDHYSFPGLWEPGIKTLIA